MQFGLLYEMQRPYDDEIDWHALYQETLEQCELADQVGFDNLWFVEHHFLYGFSGSPCEVMRGALAAHQEHPHRVRCVHSAQPSPGPHCRAGRDGGPAQPRAGGVRHWPL